MSSAVPFLIRSSTLVFFCSLFISLSRAQSPTVNPDQTVTPPNETKSLVQGKVVQDPGGQGIPKVKLFVTTASAEFVRSYRSTTDEAGQFEIEGLKPGVYWVRLERSGFVPVLRASHRLLTFVVSSGQDTKDLLFHMQVAGVIVGKVVDSDGDPLVGLTLAAAIPSSAPGRGRDIKQVGFGATNDLGEYRIANLAPGKYIISATPRQDGRADVPANDKATGSEEPLAYAETYFPGTIDRRRATVLEIPVGGGTTTANFALQTSHAYRVSGVILGLPPHTMGHVMLMGDNGQSQEQQLDETGKFQFPNLLPGLYLAEIDTVATASAPGSRALIEIIHRPIEVIASDVTDVRLQLDTGGDVIGKFRVGNDERIN